MQCCRLCDFGLARMVGIHTAPGATSLAPGTTRWMAPELLNPSQFTGCDSQPQKPSDIYAFACTVLEVTPFRSTPQRVQFNHRQILTGEVPFKHHLNDMAVMLDVMRGERPSRPLPPIQCSDTLWKLIVLCWAQDPRDRLSADAAAGFLAMNCK